MSAADTLDGLGRLYHARSSSIPMRSEFTFNGPRRARSITISPRVDRSLFASVARGRRVRRSDVKFTFSKVNFDHPPRVSRKCGRAGVDYSAAGRDRRRQRRSRSAPNIFDRDKGDDRGQSIRTTRPAARHGRCPPTERRLCRRRRFLRRPVPFRALAQQAVAGAASPRGSRRPGRTRELVELPAASFRRVRAVQESSSSPAADGTGAGLRGEGGEPVLEFAAGAPVGAADQDVGNPGRWSIRQRDEERRSRGRPSWTRSTPASA